MDIRAQAWCHVHHGVEPIGPASLAAKRQRVAAAGQGPDERSFPPAVDPYDATGDGSALAATRALLTVRSRADAARVLSTVINDMGGCVVPARLAGPEAMPVDVSLGAGEPMVVVVLDPMDLASLRLARHLPLLIEDALSAARRCEDDQRQRTRASTDALTGVATRAEIGPRLHACASGDVVCMLDVDGLKVLNDTFGHAAGDRVLKALGDALRNGTRHDDFVGRFGGDEFIVVLADTSSQVACERMAQLTVDWLAQSGHRPGVSVGVAAVDQRGAVIASRAADVALYRAKRLTRGVEIATSDDYLPDGPRP
jgi:diguanylate cyclase (GGDEF)-like protein